MNKADLIIHPIRMRILMTLSGRKMTTREISAALTDISQASIYRHVQLLHKEGILYVAEEIPARGLIERVYAYNDQDTLLTHELQSATGEDYYRYFQTFIDTMMSQYRDYLKCGSQTPRQDGVALWGEALYLTSQEREEMMQELQDATLKRLNNPATSNRSRFIVSRIIIPDRTIATGDQETEHEQPDTTARNTALTGDIRLNTVSETVKEIVKETVKETVNKKNEKNQQNQKRAKKQGGQ